MQVRLVTLPLTAIFCLIVALGACVDAPDFNRAAFDSQFNADVLAFFRKHLF